MGQGRDAPKCVVFGVRHGITRLSYISYNFLHQNVASKNSKLSIFLQRFLCAFLFLISFYSTNVFAIDAVELSSMFFHEDISTPCINCHQASDKHAAETDNCQSCHNSKSFVNNIIFDHAQSHQLCKECHDNIFVGGVPTDHLETNAKCDTCHTTQAWLPMLVDHQKIKEACESCHDDHLVAGKHPQHITTGNQCQSCHSSISWQEIIQFDHEQVNGICVSCHNNLNISGKQDQHIITSDQCEAWHIVDA